jgi:hypothetical protein
LAKLVVLILSLFPFLTHAEFQFGIEGGAVWQLRNDLQRPQVEGATRLALDEIDKGPESFYRLEAYYRPNSNHGFRALYAPFALEVTDTPSQVIRYNDQDFVAGEEVTYRYMFNSYRLTYYYAFWGHGESQFNVGFTAKIRDAETRLTQGSTVTSYDNVGFVPLLYIEYQKAINSNWFFHFNFDGLAGGPGRAFDFSFKLRRKVNDWGMLGIGTRTLEGGADNEKIYNFSLLQYALIEFVAVF